ncbi:hypothetical protein V7147_10280 [Bacillus sp. JJ1521]|uniref:hypothetical protein n=1 Tax=Bacillus sp. JJ1521 TaxID=3122957 RepID=UPI002FFED276
MNRPKFPYPYVLIAIAVGISVVIAIQIYPFKTTADLVVFTITILGLVISFIAFIISMKTYISIDSVNVITQMDGNVLENENYVTSITSLLREYDMERSKDVGDSIFAILENRFSKRSKTAIEFATNLQYFIDVIVFFPFLFNSADENQKQNMDRMNRLLGAIEKRRDALLSISTGNLILIEETVKLIKCVINYQRLINTNEYTITSTLLEVRGTMLKNSVTQTVYYNYLGLFYNKKAMAILRNQLQLGNKDAFEIEVMKKIVKNMDKLSGEQAELYTMYLTESKNAFKKALENCQDDVMWEGFIKYNDARSTFFIQLAQPSYNGADWLEIMNEAITARNRLNILIDDILELDNSSYLQEAFIYQEYLARLVTYNILIATNSHITDTLGKVKYAYPTYNRIQDDRFVKVPITGRFNRIEEYQQDIINFVQE